MRTQLIEEYCNIYSTRNNSTGLTFRKNYTRLSEIWLELTEDERNKINNTLFD